MSKDTGSMILVILVLATMILLVLNYEQNIVREEENEPAIVRGIRKTLRTPTKVEKSAQVAKFDQKIKNDLLSTDPIGTKLPIPVPTTLPIIIYPSKTTKAEQTPEEECAKLILDYTNKYRASKGVAALAWEPYLAELAVAHSANMANGTVPMGHAGFSSPDAQWPIQRTQLIVTNLKARGAGENVAYNYEALPQAAATKVMDQWINSPGHEANMVNVKFNKMGVGVVKGATVGKLTQVFFTQEFGFV